MSQRKFVARDPNPQMSKIIASFEGKSGSGKTYSALLFAGGFLGGINIDPEKHPILLIDTEKRSDTYASEIGLSLPPFQILDFEPPYSPESYLRAYQDAEEIMNGREGFIIFDSMSHGWDDEGGIIDLADKGAKVTKSGNLDKFSSYKEPKMALGRFMNQVSKSRTHIICCFRTKNSAIMNGNRPTGQYEEKVIADKQYKFYFTIAVRFNEDNQTARFDKTPKPLQNCVTFNQRISLKTAKCFSDAMQGKSACDVKNDDWIREIREAQNLQELKDISQKFKIHPDLYEKIIPALSEKKTQILAKQEGIELEGE